MKVAYYEKWEKVLKNRWNWDSRWLWDIPVDGRSELKEVECRSQGWQVATSRAESGALLIDMRWSLGLGSARKLGDRPSESCLMKSWVSLGTWDAVEGISTKPWTWLQRWLSFWQWLQSSAPIPAICESTPTGPVYISFCPVPPLGVINASIQSGSWKGDSLPWPKMAVTLISMFSPWGPFDDLIRAFILPLLVLSHYRKTGELFATQHLEGEK